MQFPTFPRWGGLPRQIYSTGFKYNSELWKNFYTNVPHHTIGISLYIWTYFPEKMHFILVCRPSTVTISSGEDHAMLGACNWGSEIIPQWSDDVRHESCIMSVLNLWRSIYLTKITPFLTSWVWGGQGSNTGIPHLKRMPQSLGCTRKHEMQAWTLS